MYTEDCNNESTLAITICQLCNDVDYWKNLAQYYQKKCQELHNELTSTINKNYEDTMKSVGQMLTLALNIEEDGNGGLVINPENRQNILNSIKE